MGLAPHGNRLAVGAGNQIWQFTNRPETARRLDPLRCHDACFLPHQRHYTGDVRVYDIAFAGSELWVVNTRFSCLCTLDGARLRVPVVPRVCHRAWLGRPLPSERPGRARRALAVRRVSGPNRYGRGWRENKRNGGLLLDATTGDALLADLSMLHSLRWVADKLWVLESGAGGIGYLDPMTRKLVTIARPRLHPRGGLSRTPRLRRTIASARDCDVCGPAPHRSTSGTGVRGLGRGSARRARSRSSGSSPGFTRSSRCNFCLVFDFRNC
jgi:hypothetical protein